MDLQNEFTVSSLCNPNGDCVEVSATPGGDHVFVRDSKNREAGYLTFSSADWRQLETAGQAGRLDIGSLQRCCGEPLVIGSVVITLQPDTTVTVQHADDPDGLVLTFATDEWVNFLGEGNSGLKGGEFSLDGPEKVHADA